MKYNELLEIPADILRLPHEIEQKLATTLQSKRSTKKHRDNAIAMLVHYSMREAFRYAGKCCRGKLSAEMITSLSYLGLCKAAKNFKPGQLRFFSYAKIYVRSEVFRHFREASVVRNVPNENILPLDKTQENKEGRVECSPTALDERRNIVGERATGFEFDSIHSAEVWSALLPRIKAILTTKEFLVITRHYIDEMNFREIGDEMGDSRSWAQILHARALKKIRLHAAEFRKEID